MQTRFEDVIATEIEEAISIAERELGRDLQEAYLNASAAKRKKAETILTQIMTINDDTEGDIDDNSLAMFAKVLKLETVLGLC